MAKNLCPFDWEHGACREHDCALYTQLEYQDENGQNRKDWMCAVNAIVRLQFSHVVEQQRVCASMDKVSATVGQGLGGLMALGMQAAKQRAQLANGEPT